MIAVLILVVILASGSRFHVDVIQANLRASLAANTARVYDRWPQKGVPKKILIDVKHHVPALPVR